MTGREWERRKKDRSEWNSRAIEILANAAQIRAFAHGSLRNGKTSNCQGEEDPPDNIIADSCSESNDADSSVQQASLRKDAAQNWEGGYAYRHRDEQDEMPIVYAVLYE